MQDLLKKLLFGNAGGSNGGAPSLNLSFVDGGTFSPRITFSRGTNATLTGSNGLIAWAPHNLLTNSEDFEAAAWGTSATAITRTANTTTAPDGSLTADSATGDGTTAVHYFGQAITLSATTTYTLSFYAKANGVNFVQVFSVGGTGYANFNITAGAGAVGTSGAPFSSLQIQDAGNGWYRCSCVVTNPANNDIYFSLSNSASATRAAASFATSGGIFLWGAQLNVGALQSYNSTTPKNLLGFTQEPENAAWTKSNSYVQQNLLTFSEDITNAAWLMLGSAGASRLADVTLAPNGSLTADSYSVGTGSGSWYIANYANTSIVSGQSYTFSVYLKANGCNFAFIRPHNNSSNFGASGFIVSLVDGAITYPSSPTAPASTGTATAVGNGWWRVTATSTANLTTATTGGPGVWPCQTNAFAGTNGVAPANFNGNGTDGIFLWGAQLVQGADAGQYTQTTSAAAVTRYTNWDGTLTGRKLVEDTAAATTHRVFNGTAVTVPTNGAATNIVYAKAGERTAVRLTDNDIQGADFDLLTGAVSNIGSGVTAAATNVGGGWWRLSVIRTNSTGTGRVVLYLISGGAITYTGDGTSGIYVSDFQLSNSASVDPYVYNPQAAAASAAFYGPRIDYDPVTLASRGLLIEEQRTNLLTNSSSLALWSTSTSNASITSNSTVATDGTLSAGQLVENTVNGVHGVTKTQSYTAGSYAYSAYFKSTPTARNVQIAYTDNVSNSASWLVNLSTGALISGTAATISIADAGNGWWRIAFSVTLAVGNTLVVDFRPLLGTSNSYLGDGTSGIFLWGSQLELGAFATSYIPTVASQVTRNADSASMLGDNFYTWYNPNQGTLSADYEQNSSTQSGGSLFVQSDGTNNNRILLTADGASSGTIQPGLYVTDASVPQVAIVAGTGTVNSLNKLAAAYKANDFAASFNGAAAVPDTSGTVPVVNLAYIGVGATGTSGHINGTIRSIRYYTVRLPDATLQQITS